MHGENFAVVRETYPVHPLTKEPQRFVNRQDLLHKRKEFNTTELEK